jgi:hypothetical protein
VASAELSKVAHSHSGRFPFLIKDVEIFKHSTFIQLTFIEYLTQYGAHAGCPVNIW